MATNTLRDSSATATPPKQTFRERMLTHEINGVRELSDDHPADAAIHVTRHIHALALYIGAALPERG